MTELPSWNDSGSMTMALQNREETPFPVDIEVEDDSPHARLEAPKKYRLILYIASLVHWYVTLPKKVLYPASLCSVKKGFVTLSKGPGTIARFSSLQKSCP